MPLRLVSSRSDHHSFDNDPVPSARYVPRHLRVVGDGRPSGGNGAQIYSLAPHRRVNEAEKKVLTHVIPEDSCLDQAAAVAQAEREDHDLVVLAVCKLDDAVDDLDVLLNWGRSDWKRAALARCIAKGWIVVQGDAGTASQTFVVTTEGYRAADLRVPSASS